MRSSLGVVDVSTLSVMAQGQDNGSCLILGDKELPSAYTGGNTSAVTIISSVKTPHILISTNLIDYKIK